MLIYGHCAFLDISQNIQVQEQDFSTRRNILSFYLINLEVAIVYMLLGVFLVPYMVFAVTCGLPLFLLETAMGQYTQEGGITCWKKICPLAEGK